MPLKKLFLEKFYIFAHKISLKKFFLKKLT